MAETPKHPNAEDLPNPADRHGGEHGIPPGVPDAAPTGWPTHDRHSTEVAPTKDDPADGDNGR